MVFESIVADVLNRFLGDYVENLDQSQLKIGIWGGDVVLENLSLKQSALDELSLPVKTTYGHLGKLVLKIPWKNLYSAPVVASLERLFLLVAPNEEVKYDAAKEEKWVQEAKQQQLRKVDEAKKREMDKDKPKADDSFVEKLATQIIKNVQIKIHGIHIRYEDKVTTIGRPFALGITLHHLSVHTTDENWKEAIIQDAVTEIYKVLVMEGLAVYWNSNTTLFKGNSKEGTLILNEFKDTVCSNAHHPKGFRYILGPINSTVKLTLNPKPEMTNYLSPKIKLIVDLEKLSLGLSKSQYHDVIGLVESLGRMNRAAPYRKYRPNVGAYRGNYKEWWKFAYTCILEQDVRRVHNNWNWYHILQHATTCRRYATAYQMKLTSKKLTSELTSEIDFLENTLDVLNMVLIRERVEMDVERLGRKISQQKKDAGWFGSWWGGATKTDESAPTSDLVKKFESAMTADEKRKLFRAIDYQENDSPADYSEEFIETKVVFNLSALEIEISDDTYTVPRVLHAELSGVMSNIEQRPAVKGLKVNATIRQFTVFGLPQGTHTPLLAVSKDVVHGVNLLDVLFEKNPLDKQCDQRIHITSRPLQIIYDARTINKVVDIFQAQMDPSALNQLQAVAESQLQNFREMSATGLQYAIEQHTVLDLSVDMMSSVIIIPHGGIYQGCEDLVAINLGRFTMSSLARDPSTPNVRTLHSQGTSEEDIMKRMMSQSYDKFTLNLKDMQVLIAFGGEDWKKTLEENKVTPLHLLQPMSLIVNVDKCLIQDDPRFPKLKVFAHLPNVTVSLTDERLLHMVSLGLSIPRPGEEDGAEPLIITDATSRGSSQSLASRCLEIPLELMKLKDNKMKKKQPKASKLVQATELDLKFEMNDLTVSVFRVQRDSRSELSSGEDTKLLTFRVMMLELDLLQQTYDMDVTTRLGGLVLDVFDPRGEVRMLNTPMAAGQMEYLFTVVYVNVDRKSPDFLGKHGSTLKMLKVKFTKLSVLLHQEALLCLMAFSQTFQQKLVEAQRNRSLDHFASAGHGRQKANLAAIAEDHNTLVPPVSTQRLKRRKKEWIETIEFKLEADLQNFQIRIATYKSSIADIKVEGCSATVMVKKFSTEIATHLKTIMILDLNPKTSHKKIMSVVGEEALSAHVVKYDPAHHLYFQKDNPDVSVKASIARIQFIYLSWFVSSLLRFTNTFQAAQATILEAAAGAASAAKHNMQEAVSKAMKISLGIDLQAPICIVPVNSRSMDAIMLDFGYLNITNKFQTLTQYNDHGNPAVLDEIQLFLQNVKVTRVKLDEKYNVLNETSILRPVSFTLEVTRNLSSTWFFTMPEFDVAGRLQRLNITLTEEDYKMMMRILVENFSEVYFMEPVEEKASPQAWADSKTSLPAAVQSRPNTLDGLETNVTVDAGDLPTAVGIPPPTERIFFKFSLIVESILIELFNGGVKMLDDTSEEHNRVGLACFSLNCLSLQGRILVNTSVLVAFTLMDCLLDDTRAGGDDRITRLMQRKQDPEITPNTSFAASEPGDDYVVPMKSMIGINFRQKGFDMYVDMRVFGFDLILSLDHMLKVAEFFTSHTKKDETEVVITTTTKTDPYLKMAASNYSAKRKNSIISKSTPGSAKQPPKVIKPPVEENKTSFFVNVKIEKPDIILVESMDSINTNAIILNNEVNMKYRLVRSRQIVDCTMTDLQLYSCCYNPATRKETMALILHPCTLSVMGSTPEGGGLHFDFQLSDIRLAVSPGTIELLNKVYTVLYGSVVAPPKTTDVVVDYSEIWQSKQYSDTQFWFLKTEEGQDAMLGVSSTTIEPKVACSEICLLSAPSIIVTLEAGVGRQTLPMILFEATLSVQARDWSSQLFIESVMSIQMAYYNSCLALWEPLIEPVESVVDGKIIHCPWELKAVVQMRNSDALSVSMTPSEPDMEELAFQPPAMSIDIASKENLELTVTKTSLEVFTTLGRAFQTAVTSGLSTTAGMVAPYTVQNHTGLSITVLLEHGPFKVQEGENYNQVVLKSGAQVGLCLRNDKEEASCKQVLGKMGSKHSLENHGQIKEKFLKVIVKVNTTSCELELPLVRADKRYFSLKHRGEGNDPWGLVSVVKVLDGGTILTLRSILQVYNHFSEPVDVYYMTRRGNELECIGTVQPDTEMNLPLFSIYTPTNELFFSVEGYTVSVTPFVWKDLKNMLTTTKLLQCNSKNPDEKEPFIMQVVGDTEQVYFENTSRHPMDSTVYNIHLRPAVVLKNLLPLDLVVCLRGLPQERVVKGGEKIQLPTAEPGAAKLVAKIPNYLDKQWVCEREIQWNMLPFNVWSFMSVDSSQKLTLDLGMHTEHKNGTLVMSLYCPFWMLNKTGLMISYRKSRKSERSDPAGSPLKQWDETANVLYHPESFQGPILFSFRAKSFFGKKKAAIKLEDGEWSDKFSLDVAGSSGVVNCKYNGTTYQIGVHIQLTYSTLTKQVTFTPYHVLINNSRTIIECQEGDRPADPWTKVEPGACSPMWPRSPDAMKEMRVRVLGTMQISAPFSYSTVHTTLLKLDNEYGGVNVDVQITEGAVYISFASYEPGLAPALLLNHTDMVIQFWEKEMESLIRTLNPREMTMFTWQKPTGSRSILWNAGKKKELSDGLKKDGIGEFQPEPNKKVYWVSFLDGIQRIFLFTLDMNVARDAQSAGELEAIDREITLSIHGMGLSLVNNSLHTEVMYIGIASSGIIWETRKLSGKRFKPLCIKDSELIEEAFTRYQAELSLARTTPKPRFILGPNLEVDFEAEELIQPALRHIRRTYHTGVWMQMKSSPHQMQLHAKINRVQIDNQMYDNVFPVVLAPVPPPKSVAASQALKPFAELSVVRRIMEHSPVQQYKYCKMLIQEFHVKVDIGFINALVALFEAGEVSDHDEKAHFEEDRKLVDAPLLAHVSLLSSQEQKNFYDLLHFSPLKIHLSFSLSAGGGTHKAGTGQETPHFINILLQSLGVTLTDVQDVVFKLAYFERQYTFLTQRQLVSEARMHYVGQSLKQLYVLVLGLDVIGNPYGLVLGLTQGVEDLFYEPFQGAIQGPGEFAEGLVLGVRSLFGHTVGGAAGAVSRITGAMGKGIAALTFDKDYQRKRREVMNQRPASAQAGLAQSSKGLVMGVVDGVSGVFMKPISGAREEGVEGFFKGVGKGVVGLVTRPTAGVIDFASGSLDAVKRVTEMSHEVTRLRPPRYFHQDGLVRPYVRSEAEGNKLLQELDKGRYVTTDTYEFHLPHVNGTKDVLLLTDKRIMYIEHTDMFGYSLAWHYTWDSMKVPPRVDDKGIFITTSESKKKVLGLFSSGETGKLVIIRSPDQRNLIMRKIEKLLKN